MKAINWIMALAFLTSSFDLLFIFNIGGLLRLSQILVLVILLAAAARLVQTQRILWPRGGGAMALWCVFQGLLITQSIAIPFSIQLYVLLLFTVFGVLATLQLYGQSQYVGWLMRAYLLSFVLVAVFGLIQFVSPMLHLGHPFIAQWIKYGVLPRINGFSYEPSYFGLYLVMGWISLIDLRMTKARLTAGRGWFYATILVSCVLVLSTGKGAWLLMITEGLARLSVPLFRLLRQQWQRAKRGSLIVPLPRLRILLLLALLPVLVLTGLSALGKQVDLNIFLGGTGLNNTAAHSVNDRNLAAVETLDVIRQHPWIGRSLGGVAGSRGAMHGEAVDRIEVLRLYWGFPILLDIFAASGFFAFLPFVWFMLAISLGETRLIRSRWQDDRAKWLHALVRAFAFEWLGLMANQNILRVYLWFHITMLVVVGYNLRYPRAGEFPAESLVPA